jgi:uncharacterized heparinase superfamily protein
MKNIFINFLLVINTLKYLKLRQIFYRFKHRFIRVNINYSSAPKISTQNNDLVHIIEKATSMMSKNEFIFLNVRDSISTNHDWNSTKNSKLWLYNLHYFDDLNSKNSDQRITWHTDLISRWINENTPAYGIGWEPYPISLRAVNWIKWSILNSNLQDDFIKSLAIQIRYLSKNLEMHLMGNHLIANGKALIFAGLFFEGNEASNWYELGLKILKQELPEQILSDGGNFELSTMYHAIILEDLLDLVNIHQAFEKEIPQTILNNISPMLNWLKSMCHPDGEISFFNDSALGVAPTYSQLLGYAKKLNIPHWKPKKLQLTHLKESGYIRVENKSIVCLIDVAKIGAEYIPGHGHADTLSFELSIFGNRVVVNSGTSLYEYNQLRHKERSTAAHSTIEIDGLNSSEVWHNFRVARRARVFNLIKKETSENVKISAYHDGYKRILGSPKHYREWYIGNNELKIFDYISGSGNHKVKSILPLHPDTKIKYVHSNNVIIDSSGKKISFEIDGEGELKVIKSKYNKHFGASFDNFQIIYNVTDTLPIKIITRIIW